MVNNRIDCYGVATISRLLKITGLFCRMQSLLSGAFAKETCKEPTNRSHPIRSYCRESLVHTTTDCSAHRRDHAYNIWISRSTRFPPSQWQQTREDVSRQKLKRKRSSVPIVVGREITIELTFEKSYQWCRSLLLNGQNNRGRVAQKILKSQLILNILHME